MSYTIGDIVTKTRRLLADELVTGVTPRFSATEVTSNVFAAEREAVRVLPAEAYLGLWVTTKQNLQAGIATYPIPSNVWRVSGILWWESGLSTCEPVHIIPQEEKSDILTASGSRKATSSYRCLLFEDDTIRLVPTPWANLTNGLEWDYLQAIPEGSDSLSLDVGDGVGDLLPWYAAALCLQYEDPERAKSYRDQFYQGLGEEAQLYAKRPTGVR